MRELAIEWRHLEVDGTTCIRCSETGRTLEEVVADLAKELEPRGIAVRFIETVLPEERISESNSIFFNGVALEAVLPEVEVSENECRSCSCITGKDAYCRTIEYEGRVYEEIPDSVIFEAAYKVIGL